MRADYIGNGKRMNSFYSEIRGYCAKLESGIESASYAGALDFVFGAWLVDGTGDV
jgi:hypothetical protein